MAEIQPPSRSNTPTILPPQRLPLEDHTPAVSSPLNPNPDPSARPRPSRAAPREQREKKDSLKKREATSTRGNTPDVKHTKHKGPSVPSPMRYSIPEPRTTDYEAVKDPVFASHEPSPFFTPDGTVELKKPLDHAENKRAYRYTHCVADPGFRHKQFYRQSDSKPFGPRMSFEDSDRWMHFDETGRYLTNEKGWRMSRANIVAREGSLYYEVKIVNGVPAEGPPVPTGSEEKPQPRIRMGWARREAPLDAPVGFDGYSYGVTDIRFETMHKSRSGRFFNPDTKSGKNKSSSKAKAVPSASNSTPPQVDHVRTGDVIGLEINLPSLSLHRKVVAGDYNPAVDISDGFDLPLDPEDAAKTDIIRDRIAVPYRGNIYFEQFEYQSTKPIESYADRSVSSTTPANKITPHPNHEEVPLRSLPHSSIRVYKNGKLVGTAFEGLLAFLPPASVPGAGTGARTGFDDGMLGYYPAISAFCGGVAEVNFGPEFWCPPPALAKGEDVEMSGAGESEGETAAKARRLRPVGERYKEQIAEDVVWDIVDEVDFFVQDGGYSYAPESRKGKTVPSAPTARGMAGVADD